MNGRMNYKGYSAVISYDAADRLFYGDVVDLHDSIVFHGQSVDELDSNFRDVVDAYLEACAEDGVEPDRPYSGKIQLRMGPALHRQLALEAAIKSISLNELILQCLESRPEQTASGASTRSKPYLQIPAKAQ